MGNRISNKKDIHLDCEWKQADDGPPENPLQSLTTALTCTSKDMSLDKLDAYLYGIIVGWEDSSYAELKVRHGWSDETIEYQKRLNQNYIKAWDLLTKSGIK